MDWLFPVSDGSHPGTSGTFPARSHKDPQSVRNGAKHDVLAFTDVLTVNLECHRPCRAEGERVLIVQVDDVLPGRPVRAEHLPKDIERA